MYIYIYIYIILLYIIIVLSIIRAIIVGHQMAPPQFWQLPSLVCFSVGWGGG